MSHLNTDPSARDRFHSVDLNSAIGTTHILASPQSIYSPDPAATQRPQLRAYPTSPARSPEPPTHFESPAYASHVLSPAQYNTDNTPTQALRSPSHSRLLPAGHDSNPSARSPAFSGSYGTPYTGPGVSGTSRDPVFQDSSYQAEEEEEYIRNFPTSRNAADDEGYGSESEFDSPEILREQEERRAKEAAERLFNRRSQNPSYFERPLPPPEMVEIPTAHDVRFGVKGAKSPGWEEVRRRSIASQNEPSGPSGGSGGWRNSFFARGGLGHSSAPSSTVCSNSSLETKKNRNVEKAAQHDDIEATAEGPLSIKFENATAPARWAPTAGNPYANLNRPLSMAADESLKMMRGDRSDMVGGFCICYRLHVRW